MVKLTAFDPNDHLKVFSKVLTEVLVESPQEDVHLEQDPVQRLRHRRGLHVHVGQQPLDVVPAFGVRHPNRAVIAVEGVKAPLAPHFLVVIRGKRRAWSSAGVEEARKENDDKAIADTSGSARYGRGEKAWGTQVVYGGEEEGMRRGGVGEGHVGILRCRSEDEGWVVGHFEYGSGSVMLCDARSRDLCHRSNSVRNLCSTTSQSH